MRSPDEVTLQEIGSHERNAIDWLKRNMTRTFQHWIADNVDHNVCSLDAKGTLHAMGIVVSSTCEGTSYNNLPTIPRQKLLKVSQVVQNKGISVLSYIPPNITGLSKLHFNPLAQLKSHYIPLKEAQLDLLWHAAHFLHNFRPGWSGYMLDISTGSHPGKADITMLPIIDLDPTDMLCIYSTLMFVVDQAEHLEVTTPCITLDQPLWLKATEIINALSLNIVTILGGFHTMMSFVGSIGCLMDGSEQTEGLETIFGGNALKKMLSGKAISQALRAHFLVESALITKLMTNIFPMTENEASFDVNEVVDDGDIEFKYKLTSEPTALFKDGLMKKPTKSVLRNYLTKDETPSKVVAKVCVLDGFRILHTAILQNTILNLSRTIMGSMEVCVSFLMVMTIHFL